MREMKLRAVHESRKFKEVAADAIRAGLQQGQGFQAVAVRDAIELPLFPCDPRAPAVRMTGAALIALGQECLEEEDARRAGMPL